ncbi:MULTISPECIES: adenosylmethionine decarboxylase [Pseudomonas syringae group]|uniref:adenosylmethionine decarboxylase n=1 Tax=Pseudomonas syringae group TaxID=136849 RepID=UPI00046D2ED4|nr:adenosylmethionine decarboxylase [Pseudomonas cichorii]MBX8551059.1 adenosylmethionine decarboxylase [Pseudomonas cichorii]MBX8554152.1 adenosylmethionine decarboxylase [Pseudomonas cichorii]MBX8586250.1 adenosylmethionine decarboxylase [Pseudomonas cichorii]MBX8596701.1 adenosylmethionine decarboxylase [Pseudomonas cichorii]MBX8616262.1 adenosylmethionine decarboxylase [Pseudomonas cichorii]
MDTSHPAFSGTHIFGQLSGLDFELLNDLRFLEGSLLDSISIGGATVCGYISKKFEPQGATTLILLSESHASIHTYPEIGCLFFDIFTCGDCSPDLMVDSLILKLKPTTISKSSIVRHLCPDSSGLPPEHI